MTQTEIATHRFTDSRRIGIAAAGLIFTVSVALQIILPHKDQDRVRVAGASLRAAGFEDAEIERAQSPTLMSLCKIGQIRRRGSAYRWRTASASGVYCAPEDGRASGIILMRGAPTRARAAGANLVRQATPHELEAFSAVRG